MSSLDSIRFEPHDGRPERSRRMAMTLGDVRAQAPRAHRRAGPQGASRRSRGRARNRSRRRRSSRESRDTVWRRLRTSRLQHRTTSSSGQLTSKAESLTSKSDIFRGVVQAWGRILTGRQPNLSVEITRECPLRCPGCYAFGDAHLGGDVTLRGLSDYRGDELVERFIGLIDSKKPLHVSIVGGEPLVRYRELNSILPTLAARNIHTQLVTSAVRPIPSEWARLRRLQIVVSVDGLAARTRSAARAGDLRSGSQTHRRPPGHGALHGHTPAGPSGRLPGRVPAVLAGKRRHADDLGQLVHATTGRTLSRAADPGRSPDRSSTNFDGCVRPSPSSKCSTGRSRPTPNRPRRRRSAPLRERQSACPPISSDESCPASSGAIRTARIAGALRRPVSRRWHATACPGVFVSATCSTRRSRRGRPSRVSANTDPLFGRPRIS